MKVTRLSIPDVLLIEPEIFTDDRGFFFESFHQEKFEKCVGKKIYFVQENHSKSQMGVLRGLHYQVSPRAQGKLVRVIQGEVFDVALDLRQSSPTCGQWTAEYLSAQNRRQMWIPEGFAHGFLTLSETAEFLYRTTDFYSLDHERGIIWNDPDLRIDWPIISPPILSVKDSMRQFFKNFQLHTL